MLLVQALDHFVVPVDDIVAAEEFYVQVFGGKIVKRNGLNVRSQSLGPHTFIEVANKRIGVYLQKEERGRGRQQEPITMASSFHQRLHSCGKKNCRLSLGAMQIIPILR